MSARGETSELRAQLGLAAPLIVGQIGHQLMSMVDVAMLGRYSDAALAGVGIASGLLLAVTVLGMGMIMGLDTLVPQALGAGERTRARALLSEGVRTALLIAVPLMALAALTPLLLLPAGVNAETRTEAWIYVFARLPAIVPQLVFTALRSYLQASAVTRPLVIAVVVGNVVNVIANGLLIFGDRALERVGLPGVSLPALGSAGAGIATTLVTLVTMAIAFAAVARMHADGPARGRVLIPRREPALRRAILRLGTPVGFHLLAEVGVFALVATLAGRLGTLAAASHQIAITIASLMFHVVLGMATATSVRVGLAVGRDDQAGARHAGLTGLGAGASFMLVSALVLVSQPHALARLFTNDPAIVEAAVPLLRIAAVFQLSDAIQVIAAGALRGAGDTRSPMWANLAGHYIIGMSVAVILAFPFGMGAAGLWWGLSAGLTAVAILLLIRFLSLTRRPIARSQ